MSQIDNAKISGNSWRRPWKKVVCHLRHILVHCNDGTFQDVHHYEIGSVRYNEECKDRCGFSLQLEEDSDYDKLSDMVKYLDLELHFGTQKSPGE